MATFAQIKDIRLRINDPEGFQDFLETAALPAAPAPYTAYKYSATGAYMATDIQTGTVASNYTVQAVRVSDARISTWIDAYGLDVAECKSLESIYRAVGAELRYKRLEGGAEITEMANLQETVNFYRDLWNDCKNKIAEDNNVSTGRWSKSKQPEIAGGNI